MALSSIFTDNGLDQGCKDGMRDVLVRGGRGRVRVHGRLMPSNTCFMPGLRTGAYTLKHEDSGAGNFESTGFTMSLQQQQITTGLTNAWDS